MENTCCNCSAAVTHVFRADHSWYECGSCGEYAEEAYEYGE